MIGTTVAYFTVAGKSSLDFGLRVNLPDVFNGSEPEYEIVEVPWKAGDTILGLKRWKNREISYRCLLKRNVAENLASLRSWLMQHTGYVRLGDCYHPGEYQLGYQVGGLEVTHARGLSARFDLRFSVDPRWWLESGQEPVALEGSQYIGNPTGFEAMPLLKVTGGTGNISMYHGGVLALVSVSGTLPSGGLYIDTETLYAYDAAGTPKNSMVQFSGRYPSLLSGSNYISFSQGMAVEVTPRWWKA